MIKLLGDESVGANGKFILGGVGKGKKEKTCCNIYVFQLCQRGSNWLKYLLMENKSAAI